MLDYFGELNLELDEVDKEDTFECLKELIYEPVFNVIFKKYTEISTKTKSDNSPLYKYVIINIFCNTIIMKKFE